jgi:hypothetical protein
MAYFFPEGSKIQFSSTLAAAVNVTSGTNANPTVLTTGAAHGYANNDELLFASTWEDANSSVFRATSLTATTLSLQGLDTTNTSFYAVGGGAGTLRRFSGWTDMPQVLSISTSGGDARLTTVNPLASRNAINIPTGFNASSMSITMAHDPSLVAYQQLLAISRTLTPIGIKMVLGGGAVTLAYGYVSVSETPQLSVGQVNQVQASITVLGRTISY